MLLMTRVNGRWLAETENLDGATVWASGDTPGLALKAAEENVRGQIALCEAPGMFDARLYLRAKLALEEMQAVRFVEGPDPRD